MRVTFSITCSGLRVNYARFRKLFTVQKIQTEPSQSAVILKTSKFNNYNRRVRLRMIILFKNQICNEPDFLVIFANYLEISIKTDFIFFSIFI